MSLCPPIPGRLFGQLPPVRIERTTPSLGIKTGQSAPVQPCPQHL